MEKHKLARLEPAIRNYRQRPDFIHNGIRTMIGQLLDPVVLDLAAACGVNDVSQLCRYPLLLKTVELRDAVLRELTASGLGASAMYPEPLPHISGLTEILAPQERFPEAEKFSKRILTLPTHSAVTEGHLERMHEIFRQFLVRREGTSRRL